jgi:predicted PhzF superfamily epimerase YddE/YHI9
VSLSKYYNPGEAEPNLQALWEIAGVYHYTSNDERAVCSIDIPPATVSGDLHRGMAAYLWYYGLIDQSTFIAEQGHWLNRSDRTDVEVIRFPEVIQSAKVGGQAVTFIRGEFIL